MVLLYRRLYGLRGWLVSMVVAGPPSAGKATFVKQLLEQRAWRRTRWRGR